MTILQPSENSQVTATAALRKRGTVLLQTATTVATNEDGTKMTKARILFDSGSHRSYVTNDSKSRLNLKSYKNRDAEFKHLRGAEIPKAKLRISESSSQR